VTQVFLFLATNLDDGNREKQWRQRNIFKSEKYFQEQGQKLLTLRPIQKHVFPVNYTICASFKEALLQQHFRLMKADLEIYSLLGYHVIGNSIPKCWYRITTLRCVVSESSADLIYIVAED